MALEAFVAKWCIADYPPTQVSEADLLAAEQRLHTKLPADYRSEVLRVGLPRPTAALLDSIAEPALDLDPVGDFLSPGDIVSETEGWRPLGLPKSGVAFATDGCGSLFYFDAESPSPNAVLFFDHEFQSVKEVASCFTEWIERLNEVERLELD
jgi:hypothetical protein